MRILKDLRRRSGIDKKTSLHYTHTVAYILHNGKIVRYAAEGGDTRSSLLRWVRKAMPEKKTVTEQATDWFKVRQAGFGKGKAK